MNRIARIISLLTLVSLLSAAPAAFAEENAFREIFLDAFYGGAAGTLVGLALTAFTKKPADHMENLGYGAAAGVVVGAGYGVAKSSRAFAEIGKGGVRIAVPRIMPDLVESPTTRQSTITWKADILRGTFY
ncbi:MAG TPA: hypothetical protein VIH45_06115 [Desulfuromonadaceae bacterium]